MRSTLCTTLLFVLSLLFVGHEASASNVATRDARVPTSDWSDQINRYEYDAATNGPVLRASAVATTLVLASYKFDSGAACTANSWTSVDVTAQTGDYWHVDDFTTAPWGGTTTGAGVSLTPIQGARSMWMAALPPTGGPVNTILCGYLALPGYGNGWNQSFCSKACLAPNAGGPSADLDVAFVIRFDTEPSYDGTVLEYTTDCAGNVGWTQIDGGFTAVGWSGPGQVSVASSYPVGAAPVKVRIHFTSDTSW